MTEHQCERRFAAPFVLLKPLCSKRGGEKKIMFYYPLSSCCFVLRGSRSEEVWPEEQRCKAQHRAAPLLLPGPFCPTTPAPKGAFGVLLGCWYPSRSGRAELCSQPRCLHRVPPHGSREGAAGPALPGEAHLLLYDFYPPPHCWGCQRVAAGRWSRARFNGCRCGAASCGTQRAGVGARQCVSRAGRWSGGPGLCPIEFPGKGSPGPCTTSFSQRKPRAGTRASPVPSWGRHQAQGGSGAAAAPQHRTEPLPPWRHGARLGGPGTTMDRGPRKRGHDTSTMGTSALGTRCPQCRCPPPCLSTPRAPRAGGSAARLPAASPGALSAAPSRYEIICYFSCKPAGGPFPDGAREKPSQPRCR